jgi:hypothetical protein
VDWRAQHLWMTECYAKFCCLLNSHHGISFVHS